MLQFMARIRRGIFDERGALRFAAHRDVSRYRFRRARRGRGVLLALFCLLALAGCSSEGARLNKEGLAYYESGSYAEAVSSFEKAIVADTQEPEYQVNKGMAYLELGEYASAQACFDSAIRLDVDCEAAYRGKGIAYLESEEYEDAIAAFNQALNSASGRVTDLEYDILLYRGEAQRKAGDYEGAENTYTVLLETRGEDAGTYYLRGMVRAASAAAGIGAYEAASEDFDKAVQLSPADYNLYLNIYYCLSEYGRSDLGTVYLQKALTVNDSTSASHKARGTIHFLLGDYSAALSEFQYEEEKAETEMLICIGLCYQAQGSYDTSYEYFERALEMGGEDAEIYYQMGMCMFSTQAYQSAVAYFLRALDMGDSIYQKEMMYTLGICYERLYQYEDALAAFQSYAAVYGSSAELDKEIQFLSTR